MTLTDVTLPGPCGIWPISKSNAMFSAEFVIGPTSVNQMADPWYVPWVPPNGVPVTATVSDTVAG